MRLEKTNEATKTVIVIFIAVAMIAIALMKG